ncbi:MAG: transcription antitermination factor NusB, partial [Desulfofustis sp.]
MGTRRKAREAALQFLFQDDFLGHKMAVEPDRFDERFAAFSLLYQVNKRARPYARDLLLGVFKNIEEIDGAIIAHATNW